MNKPDALQAPENQALITNLASNLNINQTKLEGNLTELFKADQLQVLIDYDMDASDPRELDEGFVTTIWHPYNRSVNISEPDSENPYNDDDELKDFVAIAFPLYMIDHTLRALRLEPFGDKWDSGQIGYAYITKEAREQLPDNWTDEQLLETMRSEVQLVEAWMEGNILVCDVKNNDGDYLMSRGDIPDPLHADEHNVIQHLLDSVHDEYPEVTREVIEEAYKNKGNPVLFTPEPEAR